MKNFGRVLTAMVTPMDDNLNVDYEAAKELALYLVQHGSDGIVVCGTTGESPTLSETEKLNLFKAVKEAVGDQAFIIAGTGSNDTKKTIEFSKKAEAIGVDGFLLVTPYYNKPPQKALYEHYKSIAEAVSTPIILYNVPGRTGTNMTPGLVADLAKIPNIVAVKEASGDVNQAAEIRRMTPKDFMIYCGEDALTLPILSVGGEGVISVASHCAGDLMKEMIDAYFDNDREKATEIHLKLLPVFKGLFMVTNPIPVKFAVNYMGINAGKLRPPLYEASEEVKDAIRSILNELGVV